MRHNEVERVTDYLKQMGLLGNWQRIEVSYRGPQQAVATVQYADSEPRRWHVVSRDGFTNEELWKVYEEIVPPDSPADHIADFGKMVETRWISVSERLPERGQFVLSYSPGYSHVIAECDRGEWRSAHSDSETGEPWLRDAGTVTHWMPLPEPPVATLSAEALAIAKRIGELPVKLWTKEPPEVT